MGLSFGKEWKELKEFEKIPLEQKFIVFYAENKASMNHFKALIFELTEKNMLLIVLNN